MPVLIASLPWYDLGPLQSANDRLWRSVRERLVGARPGLPRHLDRVTPPARQWRSGRLVISQACGLDLAFEPQLEVLLTPHFDLPDCPPGYYRSVIVRSGRGPRAAVNSRRSHSGFTALLEHLTPDEIVVTGSHRASLEALRGGRADIAAIDAVTWSALTRFQPARCSGLEVVARSAAYPAPPWVTAMPGADVLRTALSGALADPATAPARRRLGLLGAVAVPREAYAAHARAWRNLVRGTAG